MRKRCLFALIFSISYIPDAIGEITPAEVHDPSYDGFRQSSPTGGGGSAVSKDASCGPGKIGRRGGGYGGGGYVAPPSGALGSNITSPPAAPPAPTEPAEPPENFSDNPGILDVQAFVTKRCTSCHREIEAKLNTDNKIRIVKKGKEYTFAEALDAVNKNPQMEKPRANANIMKALETWKTLP